MPEPDGLPECCNDARFGLTISNVLDGVARMHAFVGGYNEAAMAFNYSITLRCDKMAPGQCATSPLVAQTLLGWSRLEVLHGNYTLALALVSRALEHIANSTGHGRLVLAAHTQRMLAHLSLGDLAASQAALHEAEATYKQDGRAAFHETHAELLNAAGMLAAANGSVEVALRRHVRALGMYQTHYGSSYHSIAVTLSLIGALNGTMELGERALSLLADTGGPRRAIVVMPGVQRRVGVMHMQRGLHVEAMKGLSQAMQFYQTHFGLGSIELLRTFHMIGVNNLEAGYAMHAAALLEQLAASLSSVASAKMLLAAVQRDLVRAHIHSNTVTSRTHELLRQSSAVINSTLPWPSVQHMHAALVGALLRAAADDVPAAVLMLEASCQQAEQLGFTEFLLPALVELGDMHVLLLHGGDGAAHNASAVRAYARVAELAPPLSVPAVQAVLGMHRCTRDLAGITHMVDAMRTAQAARAGEFDHGWAARAMELASDTAHETLNAELLAAGKDFAPLDDPSSSLLRGLIDKYHSAIKSYAVAHANHVPRIARIHAKCAHIHTRLGEVPVTTCTSPSHAPQSEQAAAAALDSLRLELSMSRAGGDRRGVADAEALARSMARQTSVPTLALQQVCRHMCPLRARRHGTGRAGSAGGPGGAGDAVCAGHHAPVHEAGPAASGAMHARGAAR